jgi:hypothetical protein
LSCWVAPKIAADIWGLSLGEILALIASGRLTACMNGGFQFVRLPRFSVFGQTLPPQQRPPTFHLIDGAANSSKPPPEKSPAEQVVTPEETAALAGERSDESEMGPPPDEDPHDNRIAGWREGRRRTAATRRGPGRPSGV